MIFITDEEMEQAITATIKMDEEKEKKGVFAYRKWMAEETEWIRTLELFPMNSYYVTGDCHGDFRRIEFFCKKHKTSKKDYMIILGDAGINYWLDERDRELKKRLSELPISFLMIHGNHEERPQCIPSYIEREWHGGIVYYEEEFPDLLFAGDGEIYDLDGAKAIAIGGAYSVDKDFRLSVGLPWFADEQPSAPVKRYVEGQLKKHDWTVDYVFSHTCPLFMEPRELFIKSIDQESVDSSTEEWLEWLHGKMHYKRWYFGHFHAGREYASMTMIYEEIRELGIIPKVGMIPGIPDFLLEPHKPLYRQGAEVIFMDGQGEERWGRIVAVNDHGTEEQEKEVSYDIEVGNQSLFRHVPELWIDSW